VITSDHREHGDLQSFTGLEKAGFKPLLQQLGDLSNPQLQLGANKNDTSIEFLPCKPKV